MSTTFLESLKARRSVYALGKGLPVSDARVEEILRESILHVPSAFNSQTARVVLLLGDRHDSFWNATKEILRGIVPADAFPQTEARIEGFRGAHGTILFFEDQRIVEGLQAQFATYKDYFPVWSDNSAGMLQFAVWTALAQENVGASLQHYHPLVDSWVRDNLGVPAHWKLSAQMPFGEILAPAGDKQFSALEERFKVLR